MLQLGTPWKTNMEAENGHLEKEDSGLQSHHHFHSFSGFMLAFWMLENLLEAGSQSNCDWSFRNTLPKRNARRRNGRQGWLFNENKILAWLQKKLSKITSSILPDVHVGHALAC